MRKSGQCLEFHKCHDFGYKLSTRNNTELFSLYLSLPCRGRAGRELEFRCRFFHVFNSPLLSVFIPLKTTGGAAAAAARTLLTARTSRCRSSSRGCCTALLQSARSARTLSGSFPPRTRGTQKPRGSPLLCSWRMLSSPRREQHGAAPRTPRRRWCTPRCSTSAGRIPRPWSRPTSLSTPAVLSQKGTELWAEPTRAASPKPSSSSAAACPSRTLTC